MPVITLTSDFGLRDHYVALIKGALLCRDQQLNIVDITHQIDNYDIVQAAFLFKNTWKAFPPGTIHLLSVNDYYSSDKPFVAIRKDDHYFIGPDNGLFSLIFDTLPDEVYLLTIPTGAGFPLKEVFGEAVGHIVSGRPLEEIGPLAGELLQRLTFQPVIGPARIRGTIIHIDNYENAIVNISRELFQQVGQKRPFALFFKRHDPITRLSEHSHDVPVGETLCRINSAGLVEIAVNMGRASTLLGLQLEDTVQIDFQDGPAPDPIHH